MVARKLAVVVMLAALAGCAQDSSPPDGGGSRPDASVPDDAGPQEQGAIVAGPDWKPGYTWTYKSSSGGMYSRMEWATDAILASGVEVDDHAYGLIARSWSDDAAPAVPAPGNVTQWGAFASGGSGIHGFEPGDYDCAGPRFCFDDPAFQRLLGESTGDPPFPLEAGRSWEEDGETDGLRLHSNGTAIGMREVTVEAGTFQAMHVEMTQTVSSGPMSFTVIIEADYAPAAQAWVQRSARFPGSDEVVQDEELTAYSLVEGPGVDLATLAATVRPLNLTLTPPGPYDAAAGTVVRLHASGGAGTRSIEVRDDRFRLEAESASGDLLWSANRTGRWMAAVFDDAYGFEVHDLEVRLDATTQVACTAPAPVGAGGCAAFEVPVGAGSSVLRAWLNATAAPLGGTIEVLDPDGVVAASTETTTGAAAVAADISEKAGTWQVQWTPTLPLPDTPTLHVKVDVREREEFRF